MNTRKACFGFAAVVSSPFGAAWTLLCSVEFWMAVLYSLLLASLPMMAYGWVNFGQGGGRVWLAVAIVCTVPWALALVGGLAWTGAALGSLARSAFEEGVRAANARRVLDGDAESDVESQTVDLHTPDPAA